MSPERSEISIHYLFTYWGGFFNTGFFVDPGERLFAILLTQRFPPDQTNLRSKFTAAVYQAIIH